MPKSLPGFSVVGLRSVLKRLDDLEPKKQKTAMQRAMLKAARPIVRAAKAAAPSSGKKRKNDAGRKLNLKDNIKARAFKKLRKGEISAVKISNAPHAHLIEFGTQERVQEKTGRRTGSGPAMPFLAPAVTANESVFMQTFADELAAQIAKVAR